MKHPSLCLIYQQDAIEITELSLIIDHYGIDNNNQY